MRRTIFFVNLMLVFVAGRVAAQTVVTEPACFAAIDPLIKQGQSAEALARLDTCLAGNEDNPQGLLLKGRALFHAQRVDEALAAFERLAQALPDSATVQNNLGVIYTKQGHLIAARAALEKAVELSPKFATAHENLADVHVRLARLSYGQAAQSGDEKSTTRVLHKLARISEPKDTASNIGEAVAERLPANVEPAAAAPVVREPSTPNVLPPLESLASMAAATNTVPTVAALAERIPAFVVPEAPNSKVSPIIEDLAEAATVADVVSAWAQAWSAGDVDAYLDFYDETFTPASGKSRVLWEAERRQLVDERHGIRVEVSAMDVLAFGPQGAEVRFLQAYTSKLQSSHGVKVLRFVPRGKTWKIVKESFSPEKAPRVKP